MKYSEGDIVTLKNNITLTSGTTINKGEKGVVVSVKEILRDYVVNFSSIRNVTVSESDLE